MHEYKFAAGRSMPRGLDPNIAGQAIQDLVEEHGEARPEHLVETARHESHPLHGCFEWDDTIAAREHRLDQARYVLRSIVVVRDDRPDQVIRAFVNVDREGGWKPIAVALSNPSDREILLQHAMSDLQAFDRKYQALSEMTPVREVIARVVAEMQPTKSKARKTQAAQQTAA